MQPSLTYRNELKYFVSPHQYLTIQKRLKHLIAQDKHVGPTGEYHIRSLYFDDIDNTALHEKLGGIRDRAKFRIRIYNKQDQVIHFEKKIKFKDSIAKVKEPLTRDMHDQIMAGHYEALRHSNRPLLMEIHQEITQRLLRPKVIVDYVREPFICENGNVRITFDKELRTGLNNVNLFDPNLRTIRALDHNLIILEVKYDQYLPAYIQAALQLEGLNRQSASKYVICRKYLKTNTWEDY